MTDTFYSLQGILSLCQSAHQSLDIELEFSQQCEPLILYNYTQFRLTTNARHRQPNASHANAIIYRSVHRHWVKSLRSGSARCFFYCSVLKIVLSQPCVRRKHPEREAEHCVYSNWTPVCIVFHESRRIDAPVTFLWLWFIYLLASLFIHLFAKWWVDLTEAPSRMIPQVLKIWTFGWRSNITQFLYFNFCYVFGQRIQNLPLVVNSWSSVY